MVTAAIYVDGGGCATVIDTTVSAHVEAINALMAKFEIISAEAEEIQREVGERILAIRRAEPKGWEGIVKARCGLSRSRAYDLMRIAEGIETTEQNRRAANARKIKQRQKQTVRDVTDKKQLAAAQAQIAELQIGHARQVERFKAEIARLGDGEALSCERDELRAALGKVEKLLAEAHALTTHYRNNESDVKARIGRALTVARTALQVKATAGKPADSTVNHAA